MHRMAALRRAARLLFPSSQSRQPARDRCIEWSPSREQRPYAFRRCSLGNPPDNQHSPWSPLASSRPYFTCRSHRQIHPIASRDRCTLPRRHVVAAILETQVPAGRSDRKSSPTGRPHARTVIAFSTKTAQNRAGFRGYRTSADLAGRRNRFTMHIRIHSTMQRSGTPCSHIRLAGRQAAQSTRHTDRSPPALCKLERHTLSHNSRFLRTVGGSDIFDAQKRKTLDGRAGHTSSNGAKAPPDVTSHYVRRIAPKATRTAGPTEELLAPYTAYISFRATVSALT